MTRGDVCVVNRVHGRDDRRAHLRVHRSVEQQRIERVDHVERICSQRFQVGDIDRSAARSIRIRCRRRRVNVNACIDERVYVVRATQRGRR